MAPKSKRYRRKAPRTQPPGATVRSTVNEVSPVASAQVKPAVAAPAKPITVESVVTADSFIRDLKWTGIVTFVIVVLTVIAVIAIPH